MHAGAHNVGERLATYAHVIQQHGEQPAAAPELLARIVRLMATTQATIDAFVAVAGCAGFGLFVLIVLVPAPPRTPASHRPLFRKGAAG